MYSTPAAVPITCNLLLKLNDAVPPGAVLAVTVNVPNSVQVSTTYLPASVLKDDGESRT